VRPSTTIGTSIEQLDLGTVMKASQAVAGEIVLEKLVKTLMMIAVEHAGADRGLLILPQGEELRVAAEASTGRDGVEIELQDASVTPTVLPGSLLHYVIRTQESVILDDASTQNLFSQDEYVCQRRPRSVLCLPLVKQVNLVGILYLENSLAPRVFTPKRLAMLEMLASQAAISLDHARVYAELAQENSDRRKAEEALQKAQAELAHVTRVTTLGELAASIAHEVNQPLTAIINNADACLGLLPKDTNELNEVREALSEIVNDADRASAVLARIRTLVKKSPLEKARLHLRDVVSAVLLLARPEAATRRVTMQAQIPEDLHLAFGDRVQLQQVLLNLVMNGMDAMNSVDEPKRLLLICGRHDTYDGSPSATISVQDFGIGLKAEEMELLFQPFYTTKPQGIGIGLAISRSIIEEHGGRLWAEPNKGPGATFLFSLPAADRPNHD
jgi:signal transduction histidine kinase